MSSNQNSSCCRKIWWNCYIYLMKKLVWLFLIALIAFFPAYFGFDSHPWWVWGIWTIWFALLVYIPRCKHQWQQWTIWLLAIIISWVIIESIGVATCYPYWCFEYSWMLWPKIFGMVPYMLIFTRPPLVLARYSIIRHYNISGRKLFICWALWLVATDLILDPLAVAIWLRSYPWWWIWFWVPYTNYVGWFISWCISLWLLHQIIKKSYQHTVIYRETMVYTLVFFASYLLRRFILLTF